MAHDTNADGAAVGDCMRDMLRAEAPEAEDEDEATGACMRDMLRNESPDW